MIKKITLLLGVNYSLLVKRFPIYQAVYSRKDSFWRHFILRPKFHRDFNNRLQPIKETLKNYPVHTLKDIGSQIGSLSLTLADDGYNVIAYELNPRVVNFSNSLAFIYDIKNIKFIATEINISTVKSIESTDATIFLSVFHHMVYFYGFETADKIFEKIVKSTNRVLFFETGEFEEKGEYWTEAINFMSEYGSSHEWIIAYLNKKGFSEVGLMNQTSTHLNGHKRGVYKCIK